MRRALLVLGCCAAALAADAPRAPRVRWGQDEAALYVTFLLPGLPGGDALHVAVEVNASSVVFIASPSSGAPHYEASLHLREDVAPPAPAASPPWARVRDGVKVTLRKALPHAFDRLLADPASYPAQLVSLDPLLPLLEEEEAEEEEEVEGSAAALPRLRSSEALDALLAAHRGALLDARYPWCRAGGTTRAQFAALAAQVATAAAAAPIAAAELDLREARHVARRLGYPPCGPRTTVAVLLAAQPQDVPFYAVPVQTPDGASPAARIAELLLQPAVAAAPPACANGGEDADAACDAAGAAAAGASPSGVALLVRGALGDAQRDALRAFAESAEQRGTLRVLLASADDAGARTAAPPPPLLVRLYKRDAVADEEAAAEDSRAPAAALASPDALARFVAAHRLPLAPVYSWRLRAALAAPALPALKLFLPPGAAADAAAIATARAALRHACAALRGQLVCAQYDGGSAAFDARQYGWQEEDLPAIGLAADVERLDAARWALPPDVLRREAGSAREAVLAWARDAMAGRVASAHPSEKEAAVNGAEAAHGVARLTWHSLRRAVVQPGGGGGGGGAAASLLLLHSSHDERNDADVARPYAVSLEALRAVAAALRAAGAGPERVLLGAMRSDVNHAPLDLFPMPPEPGAVGVFVARAPRDAATSPAVAPVRGAGDGGDAAEVASRMLRALRRHAYPDVHVDWAAAAAALEEHRRAAARVGAHDEL